jgi:ribonuclease PH
VEVQGTAEQGTFAPEDLAQMTGLAQRGIAEITKAQVEAIARARQGP